MMPPAMTRSDQEPSVKNLDGKMKVPDISVIDNDDDFEDCSSRVCYQITYPGDYSIE